MAIISWLVRSFLLPNPFAPLGESANVINMLVGGVFVPLTYWMVGMVYDRESDRITGSFLFLFVYSINTAVVYGICELYPKYWLMGICAVIYLTLYIFAAIKLYDNV